MRHLFSQIAKARFGKVYDDLARMEDLLAGSGLDWTVVRPPQLTDKPLTGTYRTAVERATTTWPASVRPSAHYERDP